MNEDSDWHMGHGQVFFHHSASKVLWQMHFFQDKQTFGQSLWQQQQKIVWQILVILSLLNQGNISSSFNII